MATLTPNPGDAAQTLLYKFTKTLEGLVGGTLDANPGDTFQTLLYKACVYMEQYEAQT